MLSQLAAEGTTPCEEIIKDSRRSSAAVCLDQTGVDHSGDSADEKTPPLMKSEGREFISSFTLIAFLPGN